MSAEATTIIKRQGNRPTELFSPEKLRDSIRSACLSINLPDGHAHDTAVYICQHVESWLDDKPEVTSDDIRRRAAKHLETISPEAGYLYKNQHTIL